MLRQRPGNCTRRTHPPCKSRRQRLMSILRDAVCGVSLAGMLLLGAVQSPSDQSEPGKQSQQKAVQSVSGKVSAIGSGGSAFTLQVAGGENKSMDFVVDKNTKVQGQVREGSAVTVEYQAMENGQFLAVSVTAQA